MSHALNAHTPLLSVVDCRGLAVRRVACHRRNSANALELRVTRQAHDTAGRLVASQDPRLPVASQRTVYSLSGQALLTGSVDAGWGTSLLGEAGQPLASWDSRSTERQIEYDELLRTVAVAEQNRVVERFTYGGPETADDNQCNQLIRHDDTAGTVHHPDYGLPGSPLTEVRQFLRELEMPDWPLTVAERDGLLEIDGLESTWAFDAQGEVIEQTDAKGNTRQFKHTIAGQLKSVSLGGQVLLSEIRYNAFDQIEQETAGNGVISRSTYDPQNGRLTELSAALHDAPPLQHLKYGYDPVGNIDQIEDAAQPVRFFANQRIEPINQYRYDTLYQLIEATGREVKTGASHGPALPDLQNLPPDANQIANYTQSYEYDAGGNLLEMRHVGAQLFTRTMRVALDSNRSLPANEADVEIDDGFDANGNLLQLVRGQSLSWDARNQLHQVTAVKRDNGPDDKELYIYDGNGQRCRKVRSSQTSTRTLIGEVRYLPGLEIRSEPDDEILHVITVQAGRNSVRVLHWTSTPPSRIANDQVRYNLSDHLGSSTLELDHQGGLISQEGYYPFGGSAWWAARSASEAKYKTVRYSGKERDCSGLYYYRARYYAPWLQRWINADTSGRDNDLNAFKMVHNTPVNKIDRDGNVPIPTNAHYFWEGSNIPHEHLQNILMFKHLNAEYNINVWTSKPPQILNTLSAMQESMHPAQRELSQAHGESLSIRDTSGLFDTLAREYSPARKLESLFARELSGPYKNYAAASDILELAATYAEGGIYMDADVAVGGSIGTLSAPHGFLIHIEGPLTSNAVIAAAAKSELVQNMMDNVTDLYTTNPSMRMNNENMGWAQKRSTGNSGLFSRLKLTMHMTGPSMIKTFLPKQGASQHYGLPIEHFFYRAEVNEAFSVGHPRSLSNIFSQGYTRGLNGGGGWASIKPGKRASVA
ncbi:RHS repeat-associated core domain-containing protein [Pseudomonas caspiana]|uniref:RHS repeat-associated core domain-containing protein n=1 Tax=Pseudomonas caspiana TaxID=1451454 RepID=UPI0032EECA24